MTLNIPGTETGLTPEWLTSALRASSTIGHETVVAAVETEPVGNDMGFFSQLSRLRLDYEGPQNGAPLKMIAKLSAASPELRQRPNTVGRYESEVRFYQHLAGQTTLPVPACYYADIEIESGYHVLLLEDLAPAQPGSKHAGATAEQAELAVTSIAAFHAIWWESPRMAELEWLVDPSFDHDELVEAHAGWWPEFLRKAGHQLPDEMIALGERLGHYRAELFEKLWFTAPRTLTHADYSLGNMLFASPDSGRPFTVIDWQSVSRRRGTWDVAWFFSQNMEPNRRAAIEMDLLERYVEILADNGVRGYDFDQCHHDYKLCLLHRFGSLISTIAAMPFTPDQIQMHIDVLLPRNIAAILDNDAASLLD
ncbi:MAG: phosphotransferase [Thermomicrobiales bacterium]